VSVHVRDRDNGLAAHKKRFAHGARVTVGIHEAESAEGKKEPEGTSRTSLIEVAEAHEFGLGVPQRSFVAGAVDDNESEFQAKLTEGLKASAQPGGRGPEQTLERFGLYVVGVMQQRIADGIEPELAEKTKRQKQRRTGEAKDTPLILTGQLRSSIRSKLEVTK
jgi:hypothetical protein